MNFNETQSPWKNSSQKPKLHEYGTFFFNRIPLLCQDPATLRKMEKH